MRAARTFGAALVILAAVAALCAAAAARTGAVRFSRVLTGSMTPTVPIGSLVVSRPMRAEDIVPGQLLVFAPPGREPVVHRVVDVARVDGAVVVHTKGDANAAPDPWTIDASRSTVQSVAYHSASAGHAVDVARRSGAAVALALLALVVTVRTLRRVWARPPGRHRAPGVRWLAEQPAGAGAGAACR